MSIIPAAGSTHGSHSSNDYRRDTDQENRAPAGGAFNTPHNGNAPSAVDRLIGAKRRHPLADIPLNVAPLRHVAILSDSHVVKKVCYSLTSSFARCIEGGATSAAPSRLAAPVPAASEAREGAAEQSAMDDSAPALPPTILDTSRALIRRDIRRHLDTLIDNDEDHSEMDLISVFVQRLLADCSPDLIKASQSEICSETYAGILDKMQDIDSDVEIYVQRNSRPELSASSMENPLLLFLDKKYSKSFLAPLDNYCKGLLHEFVLKRDRILIGLTGEIFTRVKAFLDSDKRRPLTEVLSAPDALGERFNDKAKKIALQYYLEITLYKMSAARAAFDSLQLGMGGYESESDSEPAENAPPIYQELVWLSLEPYLESLEERILLDFPGLGLSKDAIRVYLKGTMLIVNGRITEGKGLIPTSSDSDSFSDMDSLSDSDSSSDDYSSSESDGYSDNSSDSSSRSPVASSARPIRQAATV